ncbi:MAG TPA: glycosyltransferase family 2 protein [Verrucomicrobiae bacterium]|nr:glycosyltransferase family 2 protein [Verrucomicrobiae bacterium]
MPDAPELSIVVPCYNEEKNVPRLVERFASALAGRSGVEVVFVDNGSKDGTGAALDAAVSRHAFVRKAVVPENQGYGFGILCGLREARGQVLAWTHADLQADPSDVLKAYDAYRAAARETQKVLVKGHRRGRKPSEKFFSWGMQVLAGLALGFAVEEVNAQPKLFPRLFLGELENPPHDFSLDLYVLYMAEKKGYKIISIPVFFEERLHGEAKGGSGSSWPVRWKLMKRSFAYIFELRSQLQRKAA